MIGMCNDLVYFHRFGFTFLEFYNYKTFTFQFDFGFKVFRMGLGSVYPKKVSQS